MHFYFWKSGIWTIDRCCRSMRLARVELVAKEKQKSNKRAGKKKNWKEIFVWVSAFVFVDQWQVYVCVCVAEQAQSLWK